MKNLFALSSALLLLFGFFCPALAAPQLVTPQPAFHFGTIAEGDKVHHVFTFTNQGDQPLIINRVRSTCGCTGTLLSQKEIPPGESGEIKTVFNSSGMRGPIVKWIHVYSNDPINPKVRLQINGVVQPEIDFTPRRLRLTGMEPGEKHEALVTLTNNSEQPIFLSHLTTTPAVLSARLSETRLEPGGTANIKISFEIPTGKTHQNGYISLKTSSPRTPKIRIPVFGVGHAQTR